MVLRPLFSDNHANMSGRKLDRTVDQRSGTMAPLTYTAMVARGRQFGQGCTDGAAKARAHGSKVPSTILGSAIKERDRLSLAASARQLSAAICGKPRSRRIAHLDEDLIASGCRKRPECSATMSSSSNRHQRTRKIPTARSEYRPQQLPSNFQV